MDSNEIRQRFLKFFEDRGHKIVPSSSLVPTDPSVLLTTAGMQQFKQYYTQPELAERDFGSRNTVSVQKCFRTSDIDEVGDDTHLTFFEMLGNFSFGGYFKKEAIEYAYEFITQEMGLKIDYVSVFEGDSDPSASSGQVVPADIESENIWKTVDSNIVIKKFGRKDNFWGPTGAEGPCGPTSEVYVNGVEIWNLVFNEFYCKPDKTLEPLKIKGVDTGMGLERLAVIVQAKKNIFETDLFESILSQLPANVEEIKKRIIADHIRGSIFLISDGVQSSNKEVGYVLRRLIRQVLVYENIYKIPVHIFDIIIRNIIHGYGKFYYDLIKNDENIQQEFEKERKSSSIIIENMDRVFNKKKSLLGLIGELKKEKNKKAIIFEDQHTTLYDARRSLEAETISGKEAFGLHQNNGAPLELIIQKARQMGLKVDIDGFWKEFKKHQEISRAGVEKKFGGHGLILDTGELKAGNEEELKKVTRLHTATHLLNAALHKVLGDGVSQRGSDVTIERTRFDFTFDRKLTAEELKQVEDLVNEAIKKDYQVEIKTMPLAEAKNSGALFFYKGNYPETVKVYSIGDPSTNSGHPFSRELCGGPHVEHTGEIGKFRIVKEEASSAGIRRIRAIIE